MGEPAAVWRGVDRLLDRTVEVADLEAHGLHLLAARRWERRGRPVPQQLKREAYLSAAAALTVRPLLAHIRSRIEGPIVVLKGPEIAARYPEPGLRPFGDLDLLVADADRAHAALVQVGYRPQGDPRRFGDRLYHCQPLHSSHSPLLVEVHEAPGWLPWMPDPESLFARTVPSATGVEGVSTLPPAEHAVHLAVHSWRHGALQRIQDLIDIALMRQGVAEEVLTELARAWRVQRIWGYATEAIDAVLFERGRISWPLRIWSGHLRSLRERRAIEARLVRWFVVPSGAPSPGEALRMAASRIVGDCRPWPGESWGQKLRRMLGSIGGAFVREFKHKRARS